MDRILVVAATLFFTFAGASWAQTDSVNRLDPPRTVRGVITDGDKQPIAGARVEYGYFTAPESDRQTVLTSDDGSYELEIRQAGRDYRIGVSANGFAPQYRDRFIPGPPGNTADFSVQLQSAPAYKFRLQNKAGTPAEKVDVRALTAQLGQFFSSFSTPVSPTPLPGHNRPLATNNKGIVTIANLPALPALAATAKKDATKPIWFTLAVTSNDRTAEIAVTSASVNTTSPDDPIQLTIPDSIGDTAPRDGFLKGKVIDKQTGNALRSFTLVRRYSPDAENIATDDGSFTTGGTLRHGRSYQIRIFKEGYAVCIGRIVAGAKTEGEEQVFELEKHASFKGRLLNADGKPAAGVEVTSGHAPQNSYSYIEWANLDSYADGHHSLDNVLRVTTNDEGLFVIPEFPNQPTSVIINSEEFARMAISPDKRPAVGIDGITTIQLKRAAQIIATADRSTDLGAMADGVGINFKSDDGFEHMYHSEQLDKDGQRTFPSLAPGSYLVSLYSQRGNTSYPCYSRSVDVDEGEAIAVDLGEMMGALTVSGDATPFSTVRINGIGEMTGSRHFAVHADIDGRFELSGLVAGQYAVTVDASSASSGYHGSSRSQRLTLKQDTELDLRK